MRIVFCIYDFAPDRLLLQPWLTIGFVAEGLASRGHEVHVVSDTKKPARVAGVETHTVVSLRGSNTSEVGTRLAGLGPDVLVVLPTPLSVTTGFWFNRVKCRRVGFASYPFYNANELKTAARCIGALETKQYLRHLLVPQFIWTRAMRRRVDALITQSEDTAERLEDALGGAPPTICIPPGIRLTEWPWRDTRRKGGEDSVRLLYLGAADPIRGFDLALDAVARVSDVKVRLRVLARGADPDQVEAIHSAAARRGLNRRVEVKGGWIDRASLREEIYAADAVLQPFVLVPSELPVTAMEAIACGTPVIGSAIDGLPSTIGPAGTVVAHGNVGQLADAIARFGRSEQVRAAWRAGCRQQRDAMLSWKDVISGWESALHG